MSDQHPCFKCAKIVKSEMGIRCVDCEAVFHLECSSLVSEEAYKKLTARQKSAWKCDPCKTETVSGRSARSDTSDVPDQNSVIAMLQNLCREMKEGRRETRKRFDGLDKHIEGIYASVEEFRNRITLIEEENNELRKQCSTLKEDLTSSNRNADLLKNELEDLQQYSRRDNIEIKGVPLTTQEDIYSILESLAGVLQIPFSRTDVSVAHRVPGRSTHPAIIAKFITRRARDMWLSAARGKRFNASHLHQRFGDHPIYINCHLTGNNKRILGQAKQMVRDKKLVAAWSKDDCSIVVKKNEGGRYIRVRSEQDLDNASK